MLKNRYEIMAMISAVNCNPNGDPDMDNRPRVDMETGKGLITDVAFKARIRRAVENIKGKDPHYQMLFHDSNSINMEIARAALKANKTDKFIPDSKNKKNPFENANKHVPETARLLEDTFWDVRTFGAVLSTGLNAGQVRGPVQVAMASSVDPIDAQSLTITRNCYADRKVFGTLKEYEDADAATPLNEKRTMGNKKYIPFGLYVMKISVSANLARNTNFSEEDFKVLLEGIAAMYQDDISASKMGMSLVGPIIVFKHVGTQADNNSEQNRIEAMLGCARADKLFDLLRIVKKENVTYPRSIHDYNVYFDKEHLPKGVIAGFKNEIFDDIDWEMKDVNGFFTKG